MKKIEHKGPNPISCDSCHNGTSYNFTVILDEKIVQKFKLCKSCIKKNRYGTVGLLAIAYDEILADET